MPVRKILYLTVGLILIGGITGYFLFSIFPDLLLPKSSLEYTLITVQANEIFISRSIFSVLIAGVFAISPISALVSFKFTKANHYPVTIIIFLVITLFSMLTSIFYYKNYFAELFTANSIDASMPIKLNIIPYFEIPIVGIGVTILCALVWLGIRSFKK